MNNESFMSSLVNRLDLHSESTSKQVLIEMFDNRWLLIEKHSGVIGYAKDKITVKLSKGCLCVQGDDLKLELQKAINRLPEKQRLVFNMRYFDEMKYEDMSEILGTSVGALKASYHHAYNKIRTELEEKLIDR